MPSLTLANSLRATITYSPFSPASLFSGGAPGVWYDPSDYGATGTLFQDSAGTTPVTAVEQPVGLMLDKSQGLVLGPELVTNGDFSVDLSGWTQLNAVAGVKYFEWDASGGARMVTDGSTPAVGLAQTILTLGKTYKVTFDIVSISGALQVGSGASIEGTYTTVGTKTVYIVNAINTNFRFFRAGSAANVVIDNISVKELPGNHAFQSTSASRPVLSARYNLLTKTEQFGDAAWTKTNITVTANATTDPLGGNTADLISLTGATATKFIFQSASVIVPRVASIYLKAGTHNFVQLMFDGGSAQANFNVSTGEAGVVSGGTSTITPVGNGWFFVQFTSSATGSLRIYAVDNNSAAWASTTSSTGNFYIWGASLVPSNQSTLPYQRVNTSTDYATTGFLPYLKFDGVDDSLSTNSISFTSTDKMSVFAGLRHMSTAATGAVFETSADAGANAGAMALYANTTSYSWRSGGSIRVTATASVTPPITNVATGLGDISGDLATLRLNGAQVAQNTADQGTGNFGNYPLYIGRRNNASLPFNGQLYSMIIVGKAVNAVELTSTETYTAIKTGVTLA